ncbi:hypothetical protein IAD21_00515 [Abditibacteriota bacterium]|nr:hypothetical protein IAD21_00515 [Abditibacteriota bacterium]
MKCSREEVFLNKGGFTGKVGLVNLAEREMFPIVHKFNRFHA